MYVIVTYDVEQERVGRILKICRKYLNWVQNSVFEGGITEAKFEKLKSELQRSIEKSKDSVRFYKVKDRALIDLEVLGLEKGITNFMY
ncbi:MAG: CRISPR-associated endoribonuclease Cas2 [Thermotoga sp. 50_1627]|uniref:CRISPR-associated endonuclease Cas2 n=1 Tax=Pseudothermotoga sp. TaxID=2033661 RepID=UPI00076D63FC|nr:MAG: CRISPR-associated endoribonuclease Cas2 [Thermotoga sp. 50_64]KUK24434.1 MAG: CRISPR-associated endoribonuclease Cas2 [Thermotoga sp. 50_1627]MBC7117232.1 CRISPR-associated endonuclease Cas2 [Pseudothermotoga sp.]HBT39534.1 CRISPR-associated endonuclease Cas2 [Pseudothermotoga sp.]HCO98530.1 CRISPR-associated endonuclease Cas2 [Pseudothermotoga sp.]